MLDTRGRAAASESERAAGCVEKRFNSTLSFREANSRARSTVRTEGRTRWRSRAGGGPTPFRIVLRWGGRPSAQDDWVRFGGGFMFRSNPQYSCASGRGRALRGAWEVNRGWAPPGSSRFS